MKENLDLDLRKLSLRFGSCTDLRQAPVPAWGTRGDILDSVSGTGIGFTRFTLRVWDQNRSLI